MSTTRSSTLPAGRANASSIPRYMTTATQSSSLNESIGSNDSFQSQAPLPFHMPEDNNYPPRAPYKQGSNVTRVQYQGGTPALIDSSEESKSLSSGSRSLDPNSRAYVPSENSLAMGHAFDGQFPTGMNLNSYVGHGQNLGDFQSYGQQNGHVNGHNSAGLQAGGPSPYHIQYGATYGQIPDPYAHYGIPNGMGNYTNAAPMFNDSGYGCYPAPAYNGKASENPSYAVMSPIDPSYMNRGYSSGSQSGGGGASSGDSSGQSSGPGYNNKNHPYVPQKQPKYVDENRFRSQPPSTWNDENTISSRNGSADYRGNSCESNIRKNEIEDRQRVGFEEHDYQHSTVNHCGKQKNQKSHQSDSAAKLEIDVPVLPFNGKGSRGALPHYSSPRPISEHRNVNNNRGSVSTAGTDTLKRDASVELRHRNPQLRSRRGQNVTATEQADNKLSNWLDNVPATKTEALQEITDRLRSPLKIQTTGLALVHGSDPFTALANLGPYSNQYTAPITPASGTHVGAMRLYTNDSFSTQYKLLTHNGTRLPSLEEALLPSNLPFVEYCRMVNADESGVIRIRNIPYNVSRQEIMAFVGRNARLVAESEHEPVHIVMERVTSKTLDCYVEYINFNEAVNAVQRFEGNRTGGKGGRLGQRHVDVELSSQEQLMKDLFPKAKNVKWSNGRPEIIPRDSEDIYNSGFAGFISKEEMVMLVKHVEAPQRSPFSKDCPQRPFECLISTLLKYPWHAVEHITIQDRNLLHDATKQLVRMLSLRVNNKDAEKKDSIHINSMLLKRVWRAVLACPGFTPTMKDDIVVICDLNESYCQEYGLPPNAAEWRYLWTIGPKPSSPQDVLNLYIGWIRNTTLRDRRQLSLAEQAAQGRGAPSNDHKLFGDLDKLIEYPPQLSHRTLAQVAHVEWTALEQSLRRALTPTLH